MRFDEKIALVTGGASGHRQSNGDGVCPRRRNRYLRGP